MKKYSNGVLVDMNQEDLNIYNQGQKLDHRLFNISIGKKFSNGFIRNGHDVLEISDRDFIKSNRSFSWNSTKQVSYGSPVVGSVRPIFNFPKIGRTIRCCVPNIPIRPNSKIRYSVVH